MNSIWVAPNKGPSKDLKDVGVIRGFLVCLLEMLQRLHA